MTSNAAKPSAAWIHQVILYTMFRRALLLLGILGLIGMGYIISRRSEPAPPAIATTPASPAPIISAGTPVIQPLPPSEKLATDTPSSSPSAPTRRPGRVRIRVGQEIPEIFPHQAERDAIQNLVSKYDRQQIPEIAGYLSHPDATVREAARLGLIQLGYNEAIPYLKAALAKAPAAEADQLRADIEFLALPTAAIR